MAHLLYYEILLHVLIRTNSSQISPSEWYMLNTFVRDLNSIKKRCISVYYPRGSGTETVDLLRKTKRDAAAEKIESAIEKRIVKLQKKPISGKNAISTFCIFGWINGGNSIIKNINVSKKLPYIYILGKKPYVKPFKDILKVDHKVLLQFYLKLASFAILQFFSQWRILSFQPLHRVLFFAANPPFLYRYLADNTPRYSVFLWNLDPSQTCSTCTIRLEISDWSLF